ncbi:MAG: MFS transporter [Hamadaea sp.]|uniref:MFS transporter n=1 Tax=Hamadaea sp. TaxID=2024425 RepID=UPI0017D019C1|nr:MFS transporter [Hamadaea sp.]NUR72146.1 MFS transporter [Hamadaea sp.]NUT21327.1 MFS transporter [Hamadaea sp.]
MTTSEPSATKRRLILLVLVGSQLLVWIDNAILGNALETLADPARGLAASPGQLQWAVGSYTLVFATLMFTAGALGDRYGHRLVLGVGMAVFGASSLWAAYATSPGELIAARAVMGAGSALVMPATMAVLTWTFQGAARAQAFALLSSAAGVGIAIGPVLSGALLSSFWWGSVFLINLPIVALSLLGIATLLPEFKPPAARALDLPGLALSVSGLGLLAYGLIRAGQVAAWDRPEVWGTVVAGLALLTGFVAVELKARQPSFDPRLLARRIFGGGTAGLGLLFLAMTANTFYSAFYLQGARGYSALQAGLLALPAAIGVMIAAPLANQLVRRTSVRTVTATALTVAGLAMGAWSLVGLSTPIIVLEVLMLIQGSAIGMVIAPVTNAVMGTLPLERAGAGSAVSNTVRQTGAVLGIALGGTIMSIVYRSAVSPSLDGLPASLRSQALVSAEYARALGDPAVTAAADDAFVHSLHVATLWTMGFALLGAVVLALFLRPAPAPAADPAAPGATAPAPPAATAAPADLSR